MGVRGKLIASRAEVQEEMPTSAVLDQFGFQAIPDVLAEFVRGSVPGQAFRPA